ncbi:MAG: copper chaperone PCu(A)C [Gammaproteobacteria bacterium]|nr:copper chaperone PCu(A)C [Gammaproteobacteria bacterium]
MKFFKVIILMSCLLPLSAFGQLNICLGDAYSNEMPPSASNIAVYITISNVGNHGVNLESVTSIDAESAMIHRSTLGNGMMTMQHLSELYIPSQETVRLEPGGMHIMLTDLRRSFRAGEQIRMNLNFSNGLVLRVDVPILEN